MIYIVISVIVFILFLIGVIVFSYYKIRREKLFVAKNSVAIKSLMELNRQFRFFDVINFAENYTYDNEKIYSNISCADYLIYELQHKQNEISKQIKNAASNRKQYEEYSKKVKDIQKFGDFLQSTKGYNMQRLLRCERDLFERKKLSPEINFSARIVLYRSDLSGKIFDMKSEVFNEEQVKTFIKRFNDKNRNFYRDKEIWDSLCRVERGKVSNKIRLSIYQRDGYRCRLCGRRGIYKDLEIDHIKPISKGGKSTYDNLQTLCHSCNQAKGNLY